MKKRHTKPAVPAKGRVGRPPHVPTAENRAKVRFLAGMGTANYRIAAIVGICHKTLGSCYKDDLKVGARDVQAENLARMHDAAASGNVAAIKALDLVINRKVQSDAADEFERGADAVIEPTAEPRLGKKEAAARAAVVAGQGTDWADILPPAAKTH